MYSAASSNTSSLGVLGRDMDFEVVVVFCHAALHDVDRVGYLQRESGGVDEEESEHGQHDGNEEHDALPCRRN